MKRRRRPEEDEVPYSYLKLVHQCYESWLVDETLCKPPAPVLIVNANQTEAELSGVYEQNRDTILGLDC